MDKDTREIIEFLKERYEKGTYDIRIEIIKAIRDITVASLNGEVVEFHLESLGFLQDEQGKKEAGGG